MFPILSRSWVGLGEKVKVSKTFRPTCFLMYFSISSIVSFLNFFDLSAPSVVKLRFYENWSSRVHKNVKICIGSPRWLVFLGGKWIKPSKAHVKWSIRHYFEPKGPSFGGPHGLKRTHSALNRPSGTLICLGPARWLVIGMKMVKLIWIHEKWQTGHYFDLRGPSFKVPADQCVATRAKKDIIWLI